MLPPSHLAIVARNETWTGRAATEPHECGWAREAAVFVRALKPPVDLPPRAHARVQVSPDGMHWVDEGTLVVLPGREGETTFTRLREFGGWLRLLCDLPEGASITLLVSIHLKA
jgi:hypothetical protein